MDLLRRGAAQYRRRRNQVRHTAALARTGVERHVLARRSRPAAAARSRILCYHSVGTPACGVNDVSPARFARHLGRAVDSGYTFVPAADLVTDPQVGARELALTFDDGMRSVLTHAAPVLRDMGIPWTLFVVTDWADGGHAQLGRAGLLDWHEIESLAAAGATIGSHSVTHPNFARIGAGAAADELGRSREVIRARTGIDTTEFAIPFGQSGNWSPAAHQAALAAGYRTVYAQSVDRRPAGTVPRTFITCFDTDRVFAAALRGAFDTWEEWF